jgi:diguanylate cyclase (GGDEF)-like protein
MNVKGSDQSLLEEEAHGARRLLFLLVTGTSVFLLSVFGGFYLYQKRIMNQNLEQRATMIGSYLVQLVTTTLNDEAGIECPVVSMVGQSNLPQAPVHVRILVENDGLMDPVDRESIAILKKKKRPVVSSHLANGARLVRYYQQIPIHSQCLQCHYPQSHAGAGSGVMAIEILSSDTDELMVEVERFIFSMGGLSALMFLGVIYVLGWRGMKQRFEALATAHYHSTFDPLTGLLNRSAFVAGLEREIERKGRTESELSLMVLDIDHFGSINKRFGRRMGDVVLKAIAQIVKVELRSYDSFGRTGDKEFMIILPQTHLEGAREVAERIVAKVSSQAIELRGEKTPVTLSIGVVSVSELSERVDGVIIRLMSALANAVSNGGNRIETDDLFRIKP